MNRLLLSGLALSLTGAAFAFGCSGGGPTSPAAPNDGGAGGDTSTGDDGAPGPSGDAGGDAAGPAQTVTFAYRPQWSGVTKVEVVGGFGQPTDWSKTASLVTLAKDSSGNYTATVTLPPGTYLYLFRVTGDAQAADPATYVRYAVDPLDTAFAPCPMQSPTYSKIDANPCSQLVVGATGAPPPAAPVHVKGTLTVDAAPAAGWLVVLEREEPKSHHFFANRVTTGSDGSFDLVGSAGHYRLQAQHPSFLSETDQQLDPLAAVDAGGSVLRRAVSNAFPLATSDVTVAAPDLAFHAYPRFAPVGDGGSLPTQFTFESGTQARLDVYGSLMDGGVVEIGDPWYAGADTTDGGAVFSGAFNTHAAMQDAAVPGTRYMWGTEEPWGMDAGVAWVKQTMAFPIVWQ
jgi:hypothetical protein